MKNLSKLFPSCSNILLILVLLVVLLVLSDGALWGEKILVTRFTSLGVEINEVKLEVATKLFIGELSRAADPGVHIHDTFQECVTVACAVAIGVEENAEKVMIGSINRLDPSKYFAELKVVDVEKGVVIYSTQYSMASVDNIDVVMRILARAYLEKSQAEEIAEKEEVSWKKRANSMPAIRVGYSYMVGDSSYQREGELERPERTFDIDIGYFYWMTNKIAIEFDVRFQLRNRGLQLLVPIYYFPSGGNFSPFVNVGPGFGFGPPKSSNVTDYFGSDRDGFCFIAGCGVLLFRDYNFNLIFNPRYTIILNDHNDQGIGLVFGITWAPK